MSTTAELFLPNEQATLSFGIKLAGVLRPGDLILLHGDLGAGKTALCRAIIRSLCKDMELDVPSPSFALVQPYEGHGQSIIHADLYRLAHAGDIEELGLFDDPDAVVLVEWPARAPRLSDIATMTISLTIPVGGEGRNIAIWVGDDRILPATAG